MGQADMIVAIAALIGSLILVTSGSRFRAIPLGRRVRMGAIWVVIFLAVILLAQIIGPRLAP